MNHFKNQKGFTLTELIVGMAIFVLVFGGVYYALTAMIRSQRYNFEAAANVQSEREILNNISSEIRNAVKISSPALGNSDIKIQYKKNGDIADRTIEIGQNSDANTVVFKDTSGVTIQRYGQGRVTDIHFIRDPIIPRAVTIKGTIKNMVIKNTEILPVPSNDFSTIVYTLIGGDGL